MTIPDTPAYTIYKPESVAPQPGETVECCFIGTIETPYKRMADCPNRHIKRDYLPCTLRLAPDYAPGLLGLKEGDRALVLYWLHLARRDMVQLPAREGVRNTPVGVFSLRTPPRPNPIAASVVEIIAVRDGTPLLDIKRERGPVRAKS